MSSSNDNSILTNQLPVSLDVHPNDKHHGEILQLYLRRVANAVNTKESGLFLNQETASFQQWFITGNPQQTRNGYRKVVPCGALPNPAINPLKQVPHGIPFTSNYSVTAIYGAATDPVALNYISLPHPSTVLANTVEVFLDGTYINIRTSINYSRYTISYIIVEYLKN